MALLAVYKMNQRGVNGNLLTPFYYIIQWQSINTLSLYHAWLAVENMKKRGVKTNKQMYRDGHKLVERLQC